MQPILGAASAALATPLFWLLALAIALSGSDRRVLVGLVAFSAGHALALVGADLGLRLPSASFASVWIAAACVVVFSSRVRTREPERGFAATFLAVGALSGLPASSPAVPQDALVSLFTANLGSGLAVWVVTLGVLGARASLGRMGPRSRAHSNAVPAAPSHPGRSWTPWGIFLLGVLSVILGANAFRASLSPPEMKPASIFSTAAEAAAIQRRSASVPLFQRLDEPAVAFLTLEPAQLRVEILVRAKDLHSWLGKEFSFGATIAPAQQEQVLQQLTQRVENGFVLTLDARELKPSSTKAEFVSIDPSGILSRPEPVVESVADARIGLKWSYDFVSAPKTLGFRWQLFAEGLQHLSINATTPWGNSQAVLSPSAPVYRLQLDSARLALPRRELVRVRPRSWPVASALLALFAGTLILLRKFSKYKELKQRPWAWIIALSLILAYGLYPFARVQAQVLPARLDTTQARVVLGSLLRNLYHSFDLHGESAIYDRLADSVQGDQLEEIYLANRRALELQKRGGARAHVDAVRILNIASVKSLGEGRVQIDASWSISGSVNHFGHTHYRQNRNHALIELAAVEGVWKITKITVLDEERVL